MAVNMVQIEYITELHKVIMKLYFSKYTTYTIFNYRYACQMQENMYMSGRGKDYQSIVTIISIGTAADENIVG